jgi:hypothetical protein
LTGAVHPVDAADFPIAVEHVEVIIPLTAFAEAFRSWANTMLFLAVEYLWSRVDPSDSQTSRPI